MKVVVSVQSKRSSSRGIVHYMATSKIDALREGSPRDLFSESSDRLSVAAANGLLSNEAGPKRAANEDLHHLVISLRDEDFGLLGAADAERSAAFREIARVAMRTLAEKIGAESLAWTGAIHLNTANPHAHIAIQKDYFDRDQNKRRLARIPPDLLPHYERTSGEKIFVAGMMVRSAEEKLEEFAAKQSGKAVTKIDENRRENVSEKLRADARVLADEMLARHRLDQALSRRDSLLEHGHLLRFKIADPETGKPRLASLNELERERLAKIHENRGILRIFSGEAKPRKTSDSEIRIKTILRRMSRARSREVEEREAEYQKVAPLAGAVRAEYRKANLKLPAPELSSGQIDELQDAALGRGDIRAAHYLERVRKDLGLARSPEELSALKARVILAEIGAKSSAFDLEKFDDGVYRHRIETARGNLSLFDIEKERGAIAKLSRRFGGDRARIQALESAGKHVESSLAERRRELVGCGRNSEKRAAFLREIFAGESGGKMGEISPRFTEAELSEIEAAGRKLGPPELLRENWSLQKESFARNHDRETAERLIAGRAVARRILFGIDAARAKEKLDAFRERKHFEKFAVGGDDKRFVSLNELGIRRNAPILEQALELFLAGNEKRSLRREIEKRIALRETGLKDDLARAREIARDAACESRPFVTDRFLRSPKLATDPIFTRRELAEIEKRIKETPNRTEAGFLKEILTKFTIRGAADREQHPKFDRRG